LDRGDHGVALADGEVHRVAGAVVVALDAVTLNHAETTDPTEEFFLSAELEIVVGGLDEETIGTLAKRAHQICPYSKAITGNVDVDFFARVA
ncbi:hypothetical protein ABT284_30345, partial [Nocardioides sp. NPDC000441]